MRRLVLAGIFCLAACGTDSNAEAPPVPEPVLTEVADVPLESFIPTLPSLDSTSPSTTNNGVAAVQSTPDRGTMIQVTATEPPPPPVYVWTGPIPTAPNGGRCTIEQATVITGVFASFGASIETQTFFLLVAGRESGCDTSARNYSPATGDDSFGWCQLNALAGHFGPNGILAGWDRWRILEDLRYASEACATMWSRCSRLPWQPPYGCVVPPELR